MTNNQPARARYWARGGPRDKKVRNLMLQMVYEHVDVEHVWVPRFIDNDGSYGGKSRRQTMRHRIGNPKPRFASREAALRFWNKARRRYPAKT